MHGAAVTGRDPSRPTPPRPAARTGHSRPREGRGSQDASSRSRPPSQTRATAPPAVLCHRSYPGRHRSPASRVAGVAGRGTAACGIVIPATAGIQAPRRGGPGIVSVPARPGPGEIVRGKQFRGSQPGKFVKGGLGRSGGHGEGQNTRSHPELGRENPQRRWYCASRRGRVGRRQARQAPLPSIRADHPRTIIPGPSAPALTTPGPRHRPEPDKPGTSRRRYRSKTWCAKFRPGKSRGPMLPVPPAAPSTRPSPE